MGRIEVNQEICKGCELCVAFCPNKAIAISDAFNSKGYYPATMTVEYGGKCTGCTICARMCPDVAITVFR